MKVRTANAGDGLELCRLWESGAEKNLGAPGSFLEVAQAVQERRVLLAEDGEARVVVGFLSYTTHEATGSVEYLAVDSDWRNHGVGTALLDAIEDLWRANGVREVVLPVFDESGAASFYEKSGYQRVGVLMRKGL